jgi:hypothetical protein
MHTPLDDRMLYPQKLRDLRLHQASLAFVALRLQGTYTGGAPRLQRRRGDRVAALNGAMRAAMLNQV